MKKNDSKQPDSSIYVVGPQKVNPTYQKTFSEVSEAHKLIDQAHSYFLSGNYVAAKQKYLECLNLMKKYDMKETFMQWLPRNGLADTYEKLGENENALKEIEGLIRNCKNDDTLKSLKVRRDNLLKLLKAQPKR